MTDVSQWGMDGKWIADQLARVGKSQTDLANKLGLGVTVINKMIHGKRVVKATEADQIRAFFGLPTGDTIETAQRPQPVVTVPFRTELTRDLPILGTVSGGAGGLAQMENGNPIDYALRPARLAGRTDVAGFWVEDISMIPAYKPGSLVIVEKKRPPQIGDDVVFELLPESARDERRAMIKRYLGRTPTLYRFEQFNAPKTLEFPLKRVVNLMRVIPLAELFGV
jgi:phage repressor protein C with HTH and peptisase S24 domain